MMQQQQAGLRTKAAGRWPHVLAAAGLPPKVLSGKHCPCPMCGGKDRFRYSPRHADGLWVCTHCGGGSGLHLLALYHGIPHRAAARMVAHHLGDAPPPRRERAPDTTKLRDDMRKVWSAAKPAGHLGVVDMYLMGRGLVLDDLPSCIREAPALPHKTGGRHPAMLALVRAVDGTAVNIHRTYLSPAGGKASVEPVRMMMRGPHPAGSAVRLMPHGDVLGIAEGIETAWSAAHLFDVPCWAALNAGRLEMWQPPRGVRRVLIFADNDANGVGQLAADKLARRLGSAAEVRAPEKAGTDWNDLLMGVS